MVAVRNGCTEAQPIGFDEEPPGICSCAGGGGTLWYHCCGGLMNVVVVSVADSNGTPVL